MQVKWEADDIKPGRRIGKPGQAEVWLIGHRPTANGNEYSLISLSDGGTFEFERVE